MKEAFIGRKTNWRIKYIPVYRHWGLSCWIIYRNGVRMWSKYTLADAVDYVYKHGR